MLFEMQFCFHSFSLAEATLLKHLEFFRLRFCSKWLFVFNRSVSEPMSWETESFLDCDAARRRFCCHSFASAEATLLKHLEFSDCDPDCNAFLFSVGVLLKQRCWKAMKSDTVGNALSFSFVETAIFQLRSWQFSFSLFSLKLQNWLKRFWWQIHTSEWNRRASDILIEGDTTPNAIFSQCIYPLASPIVMTRVRITDRK